MIDEIQVYRRRKGRGPEVLTDIQSWASQEGIPVKVSYDREFEHVITSSSYSEEVVDELQEYGDFSRVEDDLGAYMVSWMNLPAEEIRSLVSESGAVEQDVENLLEESPRSAAD